MNVSDLMNAGFELFSGVMVLLNVRQLVKDKQVSGVSLVPSFVFCAWGYFNIVFYHYNHLWLSSIAAIALATTNSIWLYLALKYRK